MKLDGMTTKTLNRLEDLEARVWGRDEVAVYIKDAYDTFCRRTKCIFDFHYIENLPAVANYSSDEEFDCVKGIPNLLLTGKRTFTNEADRPFAGAGAVGPAMASTYADIPFMEALGLSKANPTGQLPRGWVDVQQVMHDEVVLYPEWSRGLARDVDNRYETQGGDTDYFTLDKDGIFTLRRYPSGDGNAAYAPVTGYFGIEVQDSDYTGVVEGGPFGMVCYDSEQFPIGGPWGMPTRTHPDKNNTRVELIRLGKDLDYHEFELPKPYLKYVEFWACARALRRDGVGQDIKLAQHYADRFEMGIERMIERRRFVQKERAGRIGHGPQRAAIPAQQIHLPYAYGRRVKRSGGY